MKSPDWRPAFALLTLLTLSACEPLPGTGGARIAVLDLDAVAVATGQDVAIEEKLSAADRDLTALLNERAAELEARQSAQIEELGDSPQPRQVQQIRQLTQQQYAQAQAEVTQQYQQYQSGLASAFRTSIQPAVAAAATRLGAQTVMTANSTLIWVSPEADITEAVIAEVAARGIVFEDPEASDAPDESAPAEGNAGQTE